MRSDETTGLCSPLFLLSPDSHDKVADTSEDNGEKCHDNKLPFVRAHMSILRNNRKTHDGHNE